MGTQDASLISIFGKRERQREGGKGEKEERVRGRGRSGREKGRFVRKERQRER